MENKKFKKNDSGFICINCGKNVSPLIYTSRNHCPHCLHSIHVDITPGDRLNGCGGILKPFFAEINPKRGFIIHFKCAVCHETKKNIAARDDDGDLLISLTVNKNLI